MGQRIILLCALLWAVTLCEATTYYVDATGGDDSNGGTNSAAPWKTVGKIVISSFSPGDSVLFKRGETWSGTILTVPSSGSAGNPITFGDYGSGALPNISGAASVNNAISIGAHDYITVQNLRLSAGTTRTFFGGNAVSCVISNCIIDGTCSVGVYASTSSEMIFTNCTISGTYTHAFSSSGNNTRTVTFSGCTFTPTVTAQIFDHGDTGSLVVRDCSIAVSNGATMSSVLLSNATGSSGNVTFVNNSVSISPQNTGNVITVSGGPHTVVITNNAITLTNLALAKDVINLSKQAGAVVSYNRITTETTNLCTHVLIATASSTNLGTVTIQGNTLRSKSVAGYLIKVGEEATAAGKDNMIDGAVIEGNVLYGPLYYNRALSKTECVTHGLFFGFNRSPSIRYNYITGCSYGIVVKGDGTDWSGNGSVAYNILDSNNGSAQLFFKGVKNGTALNNTLFENTAYTNSAVQFYVQTNVTGNTSGNKFTNNVVVGSGTTLLMSVDNTNFLSDNNVFWQQTGTLNMALATTNKTFAQWQSVGYFDQSSANANPCFGPAFRPYAKTPCVNTALSIGAGVDFTGKTFQTRKTAGAYEYVTLKPDFILTGP